MTYRGPDMYRLTPEHEVVVAEPPYHDLWNMDKHERIVRQENVGAYWVSTVFLVIDHNFHGGAPLLFETMVFHRGTGSPDLSVDHYMQRCSTWDQAVEQHRAVCKFVASAQRHSV